MDSINNLRELFYLFRPEEKIKKHWPIERLLAKRKISHWRRNGTDRTANIKYQDTELF